MFKKNFQNWGGGTSTLHVVSTADEFRCQNPELIQVLVSLGGCPEVYEDSGEQRENRDTWIVPTVDGNADLWLSDSGGRWQWTLVSRTSQALPQGSGQKLVLYYQFSGYWVRISGKGASAQFALKATCVKTS